MEFSTDLFISREVKQAVYRFHKNNESAIILFLLNHVTMALLQLLQHHFLQSTPHFGAPLVQRQIKQPNADRCHEVESFVFLL